uniref:Uncharacterized protein n=1 Tax=Oryza punctata TaxID=4537 RepID=A0A0E0LGQ0_ORYPU
MNDSEIDPVSGSGASDIPMPPCCWPASWATRARSAQKQAASDSKRKRKGKEKEKGEEESERNPSLAPSRDLDARNRKL